ncbi:putative transporter [Aspergillus campestris IBT 28561]|uniref:Transporter n=1 Tax=Aspergillus campestris (strain IBT 28561) TaxID=1392248 RepID=A0A2I1DDF7_ASPC2|nr:putative transporter [Aspergillus campestris IBT 28561]PKY07904.1 putative transporter [Aspergillus campestris IBT 28561]
MTVDEETPLLSSPPVQNLGDQIKRESTETGTKSTRWIVYGCFIGIFLAAADDSIVVSTWAAIASQFNRLSHGLWLVIAYNFGYCVSLPVYSSLCNVYGRKDILLWSYMLFGIGCLACGISTSLEQLVVARVVAGVSGGGMISLVSIVITDLMPPGDVALLRSYANVINVAGRSLGAPIGGLLIQTIGWRWSFLSQIPLVGVCILVAVYGLPASLNQTVSAEGGSPRSKLAHLDVAGLFTFTLSILTLVFLVQSESSSPGDNSNLPYILLPIFLAAVIAFFLVEAYWAAYPLIPLSILKTPLGGYCAVQIFMNGGRFALITNTVPYFIRVKHTSDVLASISLILSSLGVCIGGLISGTVIKRTHRYKHITIAAMCLITTSFVAILIRWRNGCFNWEMVYLFTIGVGMGVIYSAQFVAMSLDAPKGALPTCITTYYLSQQLGLIIGPALGVAVVQRMFGDRLSRELAVFGEKQLVQKIVNDARFSETLPEAVQETIRAAYLRAFQFIPVIAVVFAALTMGIIIYLRETRME